MKINNPMLYALAMMSGLPQAFACSREQQSKETARSTNTASDSIAPVPQVSRPARTGPRLLVDSTRSEPLLETTDQEYVLRLPPRLARILEDTFPKFVPVSRQRYDSSFVASIDAHQPQVAALSTVVGDFDGDHKADVAMLGYPSNAAFAFVILLSSDPPKLLVLDRFDARGEGKESDYISLAKPQRFTGYGGAAKATVNLSTDAILKEIVDKLTMLVYLDRGVVRQLQLSEPD